MRTIPRLLIAGASSGVGKTSLVLALTAAFQKRGLRVQTFKCGPDYLDPTYHRVASGRTCHNLDSWMMGSQAVRKSFEHLTLDADLAIVEGVMGLFDGTSPRSDEGSSAQIAKLLEAPVLVLIDASGMARTFAALAQGLQSFDPALNICGFVANRVGSRGHLDLLRQAIDGAPIVGGFPKRKDLALPERHLGLVTADEAILSPDLLNAWGDLCEEYFDLDQIWALAQAAPAWAEEKVSPLSDAMPAASRCRIGVARDEAFHFYYEANLRLLREQGAALVFFSPLHDASLPPDLDALYFGGGYPEVYAAQLAQGESMRQAIVDFAQAGRPVYGECGGLMYLGEALRTREDQSYPMLGLLPLEVQMHDKLQALGYTEVELQQESMLGPAGTRFRGHQFRYSSLTAEGQLDHAYRLRKRRGGAIENEGYARGSVLGSYVHAHWASNPEIPRAFVQKALERRSQSIES